MPLTVPLTEEMVRQLTPDDATWAKAQEVVAAGKLSNLGVSADGTWLLAEANGPGKQTYSIYADFHDPGQPILRSTGPSRRSPDKYTVGLLLAYAKHPGNFATREPGDEMIIRREKKLATDERKKFGPAAKKKPTQAKMELKHFQQIEAQEAVERLIYDLAAEGRWYDEERYDRYERVGKQLTDVGMMGSFFGMRRFSLLGKQKGITDDERTHVGTEMMAKWWNVIKATRTLLGNGTLPTATPAFNKLMREELLGETYHVSEWRDQGFGRDDVSAIELAYERIDDDARQQRLEISHLIDLGTGECLQAYAVRAYKGLNQIPEQPSYASPILVKTAAVVPAVINNRLRFEKGVESPGSSVGAALEKAYSFAQADFATVFAQFHEQLKNPLAPGEAVFLVSCAKIGRLTGDRVAVQDEQGELIEMIDRRKDYSNAANLVRAAGMLGKEKPALLVKLFVVPGSLTIGGVPLALITPKQHLRLGI